MAEIKFTDQMRDMCENWNLSKDSALLENLERVSERVINESEKLLNSVKELEFDVNKTAISISTYRNTLQALSDTLFIENKIEDVEEMENSSLSIEANRTQSMSHDPDLAPSNNETVKNSLLTGIFVLDGKFDVISMPKNIENTDNTSSNVDVILKAQNPFMTRPTPYLIGSTDFFGDSTVGILNLSNENPLKYEIPSPEVSSPKNDEVPSESQFSEPSFSSATNLTYPPHSYESTEPIIQSTPTSFQDQLSARLHSVAQSNPEITHQVIGKVGPPQMFASSGSTSEDESSSLFDTQTPPSSIHQTKPIISPTSNIHVQEPSETDIVTHPQKMNDKIATASILNEMISKKLLENNSSKIKPEPQNTKYEPKDNPPKFPVENDSLLPKPPKQTHVSQKPFKSSFAKSLFESSSDEDEPLPNFIPSNNRNHAKEFGANHETKQDKNPESISNPLSIPSDVIDPTIVNFKDDNEKYPPSNLKNNPTILPKTSQPIPPTSEVGSSNLSQSVDRNSSSAKLEQYKEKDLLPKKTTEGRPSVKTKVKSIFDDSDDEGVNTFSSKNTSLKTEIIPKSFQNGVQNQLKKRVVSLFDDVSDDDIIEVQDPQKTKKVLKETNRKGNNIISQSDDFDSHHDKPNDVPKPNDVDVHDSYIPNPVLSDLIVTPKLKDSNNSDKDKINSIESKKIEPHKPVLTLFSDTDSEDDLFAIPKSKNITNTMKKPDNKYKSDNHISNSESSDLLDELSIEKNKVPSVRKISNSNASSKPDILNRSQDSDPLQLLNKTENISENVFNNSRSSGLFSNDDCKISDSKIPPLTSPYSSKNASNEPSKGTILDNSSKTSKQSDESTSSIQKPFENNESFSHIKSSEINTNVKLHKTPSEKEDKTSNKKTFNIDDDDDDDDIFESKKIPSEKPSSLGTKSINLFNSQDSDTSDDDLWKSASKPKKINDDKKMNVRISDENLFSEKTIITEEKNIKTVNSKGEHVEKSNEIDTKDAIENRDNTLPTTKSNFEKSSNIVDKTTSVDHSIIESNPINHVNVVTSTSKENSQKEVITSSKEENRSFTTEHGNRLLSKEISNDIDKSLFDKSTKEIPVSTNKVSSLVNSFSLSSESEPSSPLFPEDKSVRSVKVTPEAKIIIKTDKDNPDGAVSSVLKLAEKLKSTQLSANINNKLLTSKKQIDSKLREEENNEEQITISTPPIKDDQSKKTDERQTTSGFLPSLTKGRVKMNKRKPPSNKTPLRASENVDFSIGKNEKKGEILTVTKVDSKDDLLKNVASGSSALFEDDIVKNNIGQSSSLFEDDKKDDLVKNTIVKSNSLFENDKKNDLAKNTIVKSSSLFEDDEKDDAVKNTIAKSSSLFEDDKKDAVVKNTIVKSSSLFEDDEKDDAVKNTIVKSSSLFEDDEKDDAVKNTIVESSSLFEDDEKDDAVKNTIVKSRSLFEDDKKDAVVKNTIVKSSSLFEDDLVKKTIVKSSSLFEDDMKDDVVKNTIVKSSNLFEGVKKDDVKTASVVENDKKNIPINNTAIEKSMLIVDDKKDNPAKNATVEKTSLFKGAKKSNLVKSAGVKKSKLFEDDSDEDLFVSAKSKPNVIKANNDNLFNETSDDEDLFKSPKGNVSSTREKQPAAVDKSVKGATSSHKNFQDPLSN